jgi:maltooligosyltrehalose trehalohydrolase
MEETPGVVNLLNGRCRFVVWAPFAKKVDVHFISPEERLIPLNRDSKGYHSGLVEAVQPGSRYFYRFDGNSEYPDPASRFQPEGVHGASECPTMVSEWDDAGWRGLPIQQYIIYEIHVGTFTTEGSFEAIIPLLDSLKEVGITVLELMPVAQYPGGRNWGYDGVFPFAVQNSYGGPEGLKRLVNACHKKGMAVILDVVYNHIGPEGNYFGKFGPYFTDRYQTPWGSPLNFDGPFSDHIRRFFIENALYWLSEFHIDALRLDALHAMLDFSPVTFLEDLASNVNKLRKRINRHIYLIGESDANDRRVVRSPELGGYGLDAQWNDDFHHVLHVLLTGERNGYYRDFDGVRHLVKAFREGFVHSGQYSPFRQRRHGSSSQDIPADHFVVFSQNHDQVGNRRLGERLSRLVPFESLKLAAGVVFLSPYIPLIFMGEEYEETAPFQYFTSHSEKTLIKAVRKGRQQEFSAFKYKGGFPDPQDEATFLRSKLNYNLRHEGQHNVLREFYKKLLCLRREIPALCCLSKENLEAKGYEKTNVMYLRRWSHNSEIISVFNFNDAISSVTFPFPVGRWQKLLDSTDSQWLGEGSNVPTELDSEGNITLDLTPKTCVLFSRAEEA